MEDTIVTLVPYLLNLFLNMKCMKKTFICQYENYTLGNKMGQEEPEIAIVGTKGQIVIPQRFRNELKIISKTKLIVYRTGDKIVVTKLEVPPLKEELKDLFSEIDKQNKGKKISDKDILKEIQTYRLEKRAKKGA
jgi:bifunctional DNA-binding transcriptional regulator/antitoxin component of YhaV-PrlF toxin-antitoxin module